MSKGIAQTSKVHYRIDVFQDMGGAEGKVAYIGIL